MKVLARSLVARITVSAALVVATLICVSVAVLVHLNVRQAKGTLAAKALQDMGMTNVAHIGGGWTAWRDAGAPTETLEEQKARRQTKG